MNGRCLWNVVFYRSVGGFLTHRFLMEQQPKFIVSEIMNGSYLKKVSAFAPSSISISWHLKGHPCGGGVRHSPAYLCLVISVLVKGTLMLQRHPNGTGLFLG